MKNIIAKDSLNWNIFLVYACQWGERNSILKQNCSPLLSRRLCYPVIKTLRKEEV
ncbi:hypothetical protein F3157_14380 [Virgibacillus dakarensis]|uniref:Uncharacterized protein n=1 Tax=Lentibacillus populi TaxID=1827502 RepID=A0A9W5X4M9_9BACI|nr:hypothetical protein [Virgibacillus dakarensis]GGB36993.1 hypothetical protein GCM10011409_13050 [Lentibacillus populi]